MPPRQHSFTSGLLDETAAVWERIHAHPFVLGLGDGTLPLESFRAYMVQDYLFLVEFSRVLALGAAKAPDLETMASFAALLHATLHTEMALHRGYAARFGITEAELEAAQPSAATHAYTSHLLAVAFGGSLGELAAALLPCQWSYAEIGRLLDRTAPRPLHALYGEWITAYASPEFAALAQWLRDLVDSLAEAAGAGELARMARHFVASTRYEYLFWQSAYEQQAWPV